MNEQCRIRHHMPRRLRCAVYTRKSSEEGLDRSSTRSTPSARPARPTSRARSAEGWAAVPDRYDDGGFSGGTLERPALQRLLADIEAGRIDVVVVYKIDRLSRSLMDFAKLVEVFDRNNVTFVSVTQSFNTTTSMGRLTLNILLSFAQFEREVIGERIRDKFAASRKKGMWMGGFVPLGYDVKDRKLVVNEAEAATVRMIFERFIKIGSATELVRALRAEGVTGKQGKLVDKGYVYKLLNNRVYRRRGRAQGHGLSRRAPGDHRPRPLGSGACILRESPRKRAANTRAPDAGAAEGTDLRTDRPGHDADATKKGGRLYRYYASMDLIRNRSTGPNAGPLRLAAGMVEDVVIGEMRRMIRAPEVAERTINAFQQEAPKVDEQAIIAALGNFDQLWDALFPVEQARIVRLLVERVTIGAEGIAVDLRNDGVGAIVRDMITPAKEDALA